ncbi:FecR domain-containing protein [Parapedobacter tibetensis]|uniref:FecR domain-containing protein n=1 Tax=Parapedobacter tibetensis TaxID=2972951 RepID=UPI00214D2E24|nr:FecR domain-containing protein [Parapedobacter tibetensis]
MDNTYLELARLISEYVQGTLSEADEAELNDWALRDPFVRQLMETYSDDRTVDEGLSALAQIPKAADWGHILQKYHERRSRKNRFKWIGLAAAVLVFAVLGWWAIQSVQQTGIIQDKVYGHKNDVLPGNQKAILTLSDGKRVVLAEEQQEQMVDASAVIKIQDGALTYQHDDARGSQTSVSHQLFVPKGGTYKLVLDDGTKVWVNANSTLDFPATFDSHERRIRMDGEAYFEVAKDSKRPFIVETDHLEVEALGTAFNINSHRKKGYVKTILTEGKIKVSNDNEQRIVLSGTEVVSSAQSMRVSAADLEEALAWRDGYFYFNKKTLREILDEVARWYDVELVVKANIGDKKYIGGIKRSATLGGVCALLQDLSGTQFDIQGRKLIVN